MKREVLDDGTVMVAHYDDGFYLHVFCACTGADEESEPSVWLNVNDYGQCPGCGKRFETVMVPSVDVMVNGSYQETF